MPRVWHLVSGADMPRRSTGSLNGLPWASMGPLACAVGAGRVSAGAAATGREPLKEYAKGPARTVEGPSRTAQEKKWEIFARQDSVAMNETFMIYFFGSFSSSFSCRASFYSGLVNMQQCSDTGVAVA